MKCLLAVAALGACSAFGQVSTLTAVMNPLIGFRAYPSEAIARQVAPLEINFAAAQCKYGCQELAAATIYGTLLVIHDADPNTTHFEITYDIGENTGALLIRKVDRVTQQQVWIPGAKSFKVLPLRPSAPVMQAN